MRHLNVRPSKRLGCENTMSRDDNIKNLLIPSLRQCNEKGQMNANVITTEKVDVHASGAALSRTGEGVFITSPMKTGKHAQFLYNYLNILNVAAT